MCHQCGRLGRRKDLCPTLTLRTCRGCGTQNPEPNHNCTLKCRLCRLAHLTAGRECKDRDKAPYVVRRRQWESRKVNEHLPPRKEFPALHRSSSKSRTPSRDCSASRNRSTIRNSCCSRESSCSRSDASPNRCSSSDGVTWADTLKGGKTEALGKTNGKQNHRQPHRDYEINALKQENALVRATIQKLSEEIAAIRK